MAGHSQNSFIEALVDPQNWMLCVSSICLRQGAALRRYYNTNSSKYRTVLLLIKSIELSLSIELFEICLSIELFFSILNVFKFAKVFKHRTVLGHSNA